MSYRNQDSNVFSLPRFSKRLLSDVSTDTDWPDYSRAVAAEGCRSALGDPMDVGETSKAVFAFFAPATGVFIDQIIDEASDFAHVAGSTLRLAIRIEAVEHLSADLKTSHGHPHGD